MTNELRILLADEQERVRYGLRALLRQQPGWKVVGEAENAEQLFALVSVLDPDLVLLDWHLPNMPGEKVLCSLRRMCQGLYVIILSGRIGIESRALDTGADAFFSKANPPDRLVATIQSVIKIDSFIGDEK